VSKVRINFKDFVELLEGCVYAWHFEGTDACDGELVLTLFIDGNPSDYEMSVRAGLVEVAKEMTL
jgi:hypothetical protein